MVGQIFNVSFFAETECVILIWPREMINELLDKNKKLFEKLTYEHVKKMTSLKENHKS